MVDYIGMGGLVIRGYLSLSMRRIALQRMRLQNMHLGAKNMVHIHQLRKHFLKQAPSGNSLIALRALESLARITCRGV